MALDMPTDRHALLEQQERPLYHEADLSDPKNMEVFQDQSAASAKSIVLMWILRQLAKGYDKLTGNNGYREAEQFPANKPKLECGPAERYPCVNRTRVR